MKIKIIILIGILFFIAGIVDVDGQSFASSVTHQVRPSFQAIYGAEGRNRWQQMRS